MVHKVNYYWCSNFRACIVQHFKVNVWKTLILPIILTTLSHIMQIKILNLIVVNTLEQLSSILFKWLNDNYMKVNTRKSYLLVSGNVRVTTKIGNNFIESEKEQVLLGIMINWNLTFENHFNNICKRASKKLNALARVAPYMKIQKRRIIMKSFVLSQFEYCPLIWMFHNRRLTIK